MSGVPGALAVVTRRTISGSVAKIVKLEHAWRRLDGRNDDGFQV
ncbi:chloramphenicol resistance leader peptide, partial [Pseudomonas aeruginosa]